jgi:hypothetical protein
MRRLGRIPLFIAYAGAFSVVVTWAGLMATVCSAPKIASARTANTVPYNCHGTIVFITPLQEGLKTWLIPAALLFVILGHVAKRRAI